MYSSMSFIPCSRVSPLWTLAFDLVSANTASNPLSVFGMILFLQS